MIMSARTDLALDLHESQGGEIEGVTLDVQTAGDITVSTVEILNEEGGRVFGKEKGKYITIESHALSNGDRLGEEKTSKALAEQIRALLTPEELKKGVLVIGLGNRQRLKSTVMTSPDIRAGVALLIAALSAEGTSVIHNIEQIDRGYENIDTRLNSIGAKIKRIES